ncbi:hypothetical protein HAX54_043455 [Datura stramonium]|uniref:Uncharacterized protein n=1 Tax=Datura stramonium TaxID=4076 RepID=A0ABS8RNY6_DATST|nr:hypothetical protein [Datura stramonium]
MVSNENILRSICWAATGGMDNKLIIWDLQHSPAPHCICEHEDGVTCLLLLGQQHIYAATGCVDGEVRIWDSLLENA